MNKIMKKLLLLLFITTSISVYSSESADRMSDTYNGWKLDSLDLKIKLSIEKSNFQQAAVLMLDKGKLFFDYGMYINAVTVLDNALIMLAKCNDTASVEFKDVYVDCLNYKGTSLGYMSNFDKALECYIMIEKFNNNKSEKYAAKAYNGMGVVFAMNNNMTLAEEYYKKALYIAKRSSIANKFSVYLNLGAVFMNKKEFDSAIAYLFDAQKMAVINKDKNQEIVSLQSLGIVNHQLGKYNKALRYYNDAYEMAVEEDNYSQLSYIKFNMIDCYIELGDLNKAFNIANEALLLAKKNKSKTLESSSLKKLSELYEKQGDYKKSLGCLKAGLKISDSLFNNNNEDKLLRQKVDFDLYRTESERSIRENGVALELANRKINNMIIWFFLIMLTVVLSVVTRKLLKQYKVNRRLSAEIEDIKLDDAFRRNELQEEIDMRGRELTSTSLLLAKFNELSDLLTNKLCILKANLSLKGKDIELIKEMEEIISEFAPEKSWEQFKQHFEQISSAFYNKLDILYPDMTLGEKRICALLTLNLNTKEMASVINKSPKAVNMAKCRIRKKMELNDDENIVDILSKLK